jgi:Xaa-Pro dipeptidase
MSQISAEEYRGRLEGLQSSVKQAGLDLLIVSALDSIYYLTRAGFEPLERPFFLLVRPERSPVLLVPKLDEQQMKKS